MANCVHRFDATGTLLGSFGEPGAACGQFASPSDVTLVLPMFEGEEDIAGCSQAVLVAVADRMNHRVQLFELEGQFVAALGEFSEAAPAADRPGREGWPYFRLSPQPVLNEPVRLRWEAPWLFVTDAREQVTRIDLAYAMLPPFETWLAGATTQTLVSAHHHFRFVARHTEAMALPLMRLERALGEAWLRAGDIDAVTRLWSLSWPAGLTAEQVEVEAARRAHLSTAAAFRLGSAHRVTRLRAALRLVSPAAAPIAPASRPSSSAGESGDPGRTPDAPGTPERMCVGE